MVAAKICQPPNSNLVPVVANGKVFVASYKELVILGLHKGAGAGD
jgi:hypothetical protein